MNSNYPSDEVLIKQFKEHVKEKFTERAEAYLKMKNAYIKAGRLLEENRLLNEKVLQNQEEIKKIITKGWGY